ncbi:response regulator transcription factor, partial [Streptomyces sp. NPDC059701]|uniref:response regulator transcription factor n=1 Tax=Streptomyces sp. NPDC059701 TaxID=3346914 RepID=UPI0036C60547
GGVAGDWLGGVAVAVVVTPGGGGGCVWGPPPPTKALIARFLAAPETDGPLAVPGRVAALTAREREVVTLAALGRSNGEIADELFLSPLTVRSHIQRSMTKLGARDRAQLVVTAYQAGLVRAHPPADD